MKKIRVSSIIGLIFFFATILIFLLAQPPIISSTIIGLLFLLYSEIVFFVGITVIEYWASKSSNVMSHAGLTTTLAGYSVIVFISSIIHMTTHIINNRGFLIAQIILFVVATTIILIIATFSKRKSFSDSKINDAIAITQDYINELTLIQEKAENKNAIHDIIEKIQYSDRSSIVDADSEIELAIESLKHLVAPDEYNEDEFNQEVNDLNLLIKKRELQLKSLKQGGM